MHHSIQATAKRYKQASQIKQGFFFFFFTEVGTEAHVCGGVVCYFSFQPMTRTCQKVHQYHKQSVYLSQKHIKTLYDSKTHFKIHSQIIKG